MALPLQNFLPTLSAEMLTALRSAISPVNYLLSDSRQAAFQIDVINRILPTWTAQGSELVFSRPVLARLFDDSIVNGLLFRYGQNERKDGRLVYGLILAQEARSCALSLHPLPPPERSAGRIFMYGASSLFYLIEALELQKVWRPEEDDNWASREFEKRVRMAQALLKDRRLKETFLRPEHRSKFQERCRDIFDGVVDAAIRVTGGSTFSISESYDFCMAYIFMSCGFQFVRGREQSPIAQEE